jgi:hypothetical protein
MSSRLDELLSERNLEAARDLALGLKERFETWRRARLGVRGTLLYVLAAPLALTGVIDLAKGDWVHALVGGGAFMAIVTGARINRRALRERLLAHTRRYAPARRLPLEWQGAALVSAGTAAAAYGVVGHGPMASLLFGLLALAGFHLAYGLAPPARPGPVSPELAADARLRQALGRAEQRILVIEAAAETIGNRELEDRLARIAGQARAVLDMIAQRPGELYRARKFLSVYLEGAERVASRYLKTHRVARSQVLEQNFRSVLEEIEAVFERQRAQLMEHDVVDLDIQIEVLRKRMESEGLA